uniref:Uncharacterized protein n=1 Tax=Branchiostoma floridae TaxID=7739 RepID=C3YNU1_BRAFL|eukprot:XP_002602039.1 hypothetical protein BRAFLDRAFT_82628 [Branchiostoma floridae]
MCVFVLNTPGTLDMPHRGRSCASLTPRAVANRFCPRLYRPRSLPARSTRSNPYGEPRTHAGLHTERPTLLHTPVLLLVSRVYQPLLDTLSSDILRLSLNRRMIMKRLGDVFSTSQILLCHRRHSGHHPINLTATETMASKWGMSHGDEHERSRGRMPSGTASRTNAQSWATVGGELLLQKAESGVTQGDTQPDSVQHSSPYTPGKPPGCSRSMRCLTFAQLTIEISPQLLGMNSSHWSHPPTHSNIRGFIPHRWQI